MSAETFRTATVAELADGDEYRSPLDVDWTYVFDVAGLRRHFAFSLDATVEVRTA